MNRSNSMKANAVNELNWLKRNADEAIYANFESQPMKHNDKISNYNTQIQLQHRLNNNDDTNFQGIYKYNKGINLTQVNSSRATLSDLGLRDLELSRKEANNVKGKYNYEARETRYNIEDNIHDDDEGNQHKNKPQPGSFLGGNFMNNCRSNNNVTNNSNKVNSYNMRPNNDASFNMINDNEKNSSAFNNNNNYSSNNNHTNISTYNNNARMMTSNNTVDLVDSDGSDNDDIYMAMLDAVEAQESGNNSNKSNDDIYKRKSQLEIEKSNIIAEIDPIDAQKKTARLKLQLDTVKMLKERESVLEERFEDINRQIQSLDDSISSSNRNGNFNTNHNGNASSFSYSIPYIADKENYESNNSRYAASWNNSENFNNTFNSEYNSNNSNLFCNCNQPADR